MSEPLRILLANSGRKWIGEIGHCVMLQRALAARGHRVWIACRRDTELHAHLQSGGIDRLPLHFWSRFSPTRDASDLRELTAFLRRERVGVLHVHRGKDHWLGALAARRVGVPLVRTRHVVVPVRPHRLNRWLYRRATAAVISVSRAAESSLGDLLPLIRRREVILSAVDGARFHPGRRDEAWRAPRPDEAPGADPFWIALVGRAQPIKGYEVFLEAASAIAARLPEARFLLAGRGAPEKRERYEAAARAGGFAGRLRIEGLIEDLPRVMASADLGLVPSLGSEGSSRATLEWMASGAPVIASTVGGIPDLLAPAGADGASPPEPFGRLIPPGDARALAEAILELAVDPARRADLAGRARERALAAHDPDAWAARIEAIYREAIASRSR